MKVREFLRHYVKKGGTVFISTHILEIVEEICSDFAILHQGHLLYTGAISDIGDAHLSEFFLERVRQDTYV